MKIAILVAMEKELRLLLPIMHNCKTEEIDNLKFYKGHIGSHECIVSKCGIGKVNAALNTLRIIKTFNPELVVNTGVAGGAGKALTTGNLLIADKAAYHDVWCGPGTIIGQSDGSPQVFDMDDRILTIASDLNDITENSIGLICTGDSFITTHDEIVKIRETFPDVLAVDMESAAIAHTCFQEKIPCNILRVVSDTPGEGENLEQYENFWNDAPATTFRAIKNILEKL